MWRRPRRRSSVSAEAGRVLGGLPPAYPPLLLFLHAVAFSGRRSGFPSRRLLGRRRVSLRQAVQRSVLRRGWNGGSASA